MSRVEQPIATEDLVRILRARRGEILDAAALGMARSCMRHYSELTRLDVRVRLETLYEWVVDAVERRDLAAICGWARGLAAERYERGYDLGEVQTAFNTLEEELWRAILRDLRPARYADALAVVTTVLGAAKDALAREYVTLAARHRAPSLDVSRLLGGGEQ